jgi:hypothetical protein
VSGTTKKQKLCLTRRLALVCLLEEFILCGNVLAGGKMLRTEDSFETEGQQTG